MHCHSAPSVPRSHPFTATRPRAYRFGTLTPVWQSRPHCHSAPSVPRPHPVTATRHRTDRSHCHSALNVTCSTFTGEWQCEMRCHSAPNATCGTFTIEWQCELHCHSAPSVPRTHPFTATRHRSYRLHCHSALNVTCGTFTGEWQCEMHYPVRSPASGSVDASPAAPIVSRDASMWAGELRFVPTAMWVGRCRR